jgi:putative acyl-CoA dehydrogenase
MNATHHVTNQVEPMADLNLFRGHAALQDALAHHHPGYDRARFVALGEEVGRAEMQVHARLANAHGPVLHTHDRQGRRIDQVEFHPSYHVLMESALRHRLHGSPWVEGPGGHIERAAAFMLFTELEPSVLCPVSMTYAVAPALRSNPAIDADWGPGLAATAYDPRFGPAAGKTALTMGMGMTEKQGGSDVRANTTQAAFDGDDAWGRRYRLTGHKWFMSAPMCDAFLVLAQAPGGLSCFFLPRWTREGAVNALAFQRLKDKLGNHANASSEVEFHGAQAWLVGEEGRGVPQILAMGALTRLDCALGTAGLMRQALSLAIHHSRHRQAFGRALADQPAMQAVLADLALDSEAATALALRLARAVDRTEHGQDPDGLEAVMRRLLTPVAKFWVCKRGSAFGQEAMECLGGNGYVEADGEGVMARIYREMPLNSIWEGAGNIQALDLLRALRSGKPAAGSRHSPVAEALMAETAAARAARPAVERQAARVLAALDAGVDEAGARGLARDVALLLQAALLHAHSPAEVVETFCAARLGAGAEVYGLLPAGAPLAALVDRADPGLPH